MNFGLQRRNLFCLWKCSCIKCLIYLSINTNWEFMQMLFLLSALENIFNLTLTSFHLDVLLLCTIHYSATDMFEWFMFNLRMNGPRKHGNTSWICRRSFVICKTISMFHYLHQCSGRSYMTWWAPTQVIMQAKLSCGPACLICMVLAF